MFKDLAAHSSSGAKKVAKMYSKDSWKSHGWGWRIGLIVGTIALILTVIGFIWDFEPSTKTLAQIEDKYVPEVSQREIPGVALTSTTISILDTLLHKSGGYLTNDVSPPGIFLDNVPNWEYGVLRNLREISKLYRYDFARKQSQSEEIKELVTVENKLRIDSDAWMFPSAEGEYGDALKALETYLDNLKKQNGSAAFYPRADNLSVYFQDVSKTLGSLSQGLRTDDAKNHTVTVVKKSDVANAADGENKAANTEEKAAQPVATPVATRKAPGFFEVDNKFFEVRGYCWALVQELRAIEKDFAEVLKDKNALESLQNVIHDLESTQATIWSPIILTGSGFGFVNNHSSVMASYISRANASVIDLANLLKDG